MVFIYAIDTYVFDVDFNPLMHNVPKCQTHFKNLAAFGTLCIKGLNYLA